MSKTYENKAMHLENYLKIKEMPKIIDRKINVLSHLVRLDFFDIPQIRLYRKF